jgi:CTP synthase
VHPFFFAAQFHPEFNSRPQAPSPPFLGLMLASAGQFEAAVAARASPSDAVSALSGSP